MSLDLPSVPQPAPEEWIAGRIMTLLSHYYRPADGEEIQEAALVDWIKALSGFSQDQIEWASQSYLRSQPNRRPTPADIRNRIEAGRVKTETQQGRGDRHALSSDELFLLDTKVLPTARRWLTIPELADKGRATLAYWGEGQ